jgi:hypothetical protein
MKVKKLIEILGKYKEHDIHAGGLVTELHIPMGNTGDYVALTIQGVKACEPSTSQSNSAPQNKRNNTSKSSTTGSAKPPLPVGKTESPSPLTDSPGTSPQTP